jgi:hypothetical protein
MGTAAMKAPTENMSRHHPRAAKVAESAHHVACATSWTAPGGATVCEHGRGSHGCDVTLERCAWRKAQDGPSNNEMERTKSAMATSDAAFAAHLGRSADTGVSRP